MRLGCIIIIIIIIIINLIYRINDSEIKKTLILSGNKHDQLNAGGTSEPLRRTEEQTWLHSFLTSPLNGRSQLSAPSPLPGGIIANTQ